MKKIIINNDKNIDFSALPFEKQKKQYKALINKELINEGFLKIVSKNKEIKFNYKRKSNKTIKCNQEKDTYTYFNVEDGVDFKYELLKNKIKESVIINKKQNSYQYDFSLDIGLLKPVKNNDNNNLDLMDENNNIVYSILPPFMEDANGIRSYKCRYDVELKDNILQLTLSADSDWINQKERKLPIIIDPTILVKDDELLTIKRCFNGNDYDVTTSEVNIFYSFPTVSLPGDSASPNYQSIKFIINLKLLKEKYLDPKILQLKLFINSALTIFSNSYSLFYDDVLIRRFVIEEGMEVLEFDLRQLLSLTSDEVSLVLCLDSDVYHDVPTSVEQNIEEVSLMSVRSPVTTLSLYTDLCDEESLRPSLYVNTELEEVVEADTHLYDMGRSGVTKVNINNGAYSHVHPSFDIPFGNETLTINHLFISENFNRSETILHDAFLSKGWKLSLHQYLHKTISFENDVPCVTVTYIDENGKKNYFEEKWYYLDSSNNKQYVSKEKVYLDSDNKTKCKIRGIIYEVKNEIESKNKYTYVSGNSLTNFSKVSFKNKTLEVIFADGYRLTVSETTKGKVNLPKYQIVNAVVSLLSLQDINYNSMTTIDGYEVEEVGTQEYELKYSLENGFYVEETITSVLDTEITKITKLTISNDIVSPDIDDDIFVNEDISNINQNINNVKDSIINVLNNCNEIATNLQMLENQKARQDISVTQLNNIKSFQTQINNLNDALQQKKFYFFDNYISELLTRCMMKSQKLANDNTYNIFDINNYTLLGTANLSTTYSEEYCVQYMQAYSYLMQKFSTMIEKQLYNKQNSYQSAVSTKENTDIENAYTSIEEQEELLYSRLLDQYNVLKEYDAILNNLLRQRSDLILEQKKSVNDYLVDANGLMLGFDGFGRLILIQDKYENQINIEYSYETNSEGKIINVKSNDKIIKFNYSKENGLLSSIVDSKGRVTKYEYTNNLLSKIVYCDNRYTLFSYDSGFKVISPLLLINELSKPSDNQLLVTVKYYNGEITDSTSLDLVDLSDSALFDINKRLVYTFDTTLRETELLDEKYSKTSSICYDQNNRIIQVIDERFTEVLDYDDNLLLTRIKYKTNKTNLRSVELLENTFIYNVDLSNETSLSASNVLGLKMDIEENLDFNVRITVTIDEDSTNVYEYKYANKTKRTIVMPIFVNRLKSNYISFEIIPNNEFNISSISSVELFNLEEGVSYLYDENDRLIKTQDGYKASIVEEFDKNDNPLKVVTKHLYKEESIDYYYDGNGLLNFVIDSKGNVEERRYEDDKVVEIRKYNTNDGSLLKTQKYDYDEKGKLISTSSLFKDEKGDDLIVQYKNNQVKTKTNTITYNYHPLTDELISVSSSSNGVNNSSKFKYNYGLMTNMSHLGLTVRYVYDGLGRQSKVYLNDSEFVNYSYIDYSSDTSYSQVITTFVDNYQTIIKKNYYGNVLSVNKTSNTDQIEISYLYDNDDCVTNINSIITYTDQSTYNENISYTYDIYKNVVRAVKTIGSNSYVIEYNYDYENDYISYDKLIFNNETYKNNYLYDNDQVSKIEMLKNDQLFITNTFNYDALNRITYNKIQKNNLSICHEYSYLQEGENTIDVISEDIVKIKTQDSYQIETTSYTYDINGNITNVENDENLINYTYDSMNRIIREDNSKLNTSIIYKYDKSGNIILKKTSQYTSSQIDNFEKVYEYVYDCDHRDRLISFDNEMIDYDSMGRPIVFKGESLKWSSNNALVEFGNLKFKYDSNGIRRSKGDITYITENNKILKEIRNDTTITYLYSLNKLIGFIYNDNTYFYERNIFGDIIRIYDENGLVVGEYAYTAYGECSVIIDVNSIASINPFRYRGYYYDVETQLFYCNSRYYSPELCRFISPDDVDYLDPESINGLNLYAYCQNDPINYYDPTGHFMISTAVLIGAIIGAVVGAGVGFGIAAYNDYKDDGQIFNGSVAWYDYLGATLLGGTIGAVVGGAIGYGIGYLAGGTYSNGLVAKSVTEGVKSFMSNTNNINHVLGKAKHNLSGYTAKSMGKLMKKTLAKGTYEVYKTVNSMVLASTNSQVTYVIINGVIKIGDMWIKSGG